MAELKTKITKASVDKFLKGIKDEQVREDCIKIAEMMQKVTKTDRWLRNSHKSCLVWLTGLPQVDGGWRGGIREVQVTS